MAKKNTKAQQRNKAKAKAKKAEGKSVRTEESDAAASKLVEQLPGQPRDNAAWRVFKVLGPLVSPKEFARDEAVVEAKRDLDTASDESQALTAEGKGLKSNIRAAIYAAYPELKAVLDACPQKDRNGTGTTRTKKAKTPADFLNIVARAAQAAQREADAIVGEPAKELAVAEAKLEKATKGGASREKRLEAKKALVAKLQEQIAERQQKLDETQGSLTELETGETANVKELQKVLNAARTKLERAQSSKRFQKAHEAAVEAMSHVAKVAKAGANGRQMSLDDDGNVVIG